MALLTTWPAYTDDTGTKTDGTIVDASLLDSIKSAIATDIQSATNPNVAPNTITDEVIAARGSEADLDTRLSVLLNDDGTFKGTAGVPTDAEVISQQISRNLVRNGDFHEWTDGDSSAPDLWTLAGAGSAVARGGIGAADTTTLGTGRTVAIVTPGSAETTLTQLAWGSDEVAYRLKIGSRQVVAVAVAKTSSSNSARIGISDGVSTSYSSYHTGGGTAEVLVAVHTMSGSSTALNVILSNAALANDVYWGGIQLFASDLTPTAWAPEPSKWDAPYVSVVDRFEGSAGNTDASETTLWTLTPTMPAYTMRHTGQSFRLTGIMTLEQNTNSKTIKLYVGNNSLTLLVNAASVANNRVTYNLLVTRITSSSVAVNGELRYGATSGAAPTTLHYTAAITSVSFTSALTIKITGQGVASNDITMVRQIMEFLP